MLKNTKQLLRIFLNLANLVTYTRIIFVFLVVFLIYQHSLFSKIFALVLLIVVFVMDWFDGFIARKYKLQSAFGGVVDVAGDRIVENSLWVSFAYLQLVPLWAPLIIISRSFITDGVRSFALSKGKTTFAMMGSKFGKVFVSSRWSRGIYAASKAVVFSLIILVYILKTERFEFLAGYAYTAVLMQDITFYMVVFVVVFCVVRGAFIVYDSRKLFLE